MPGNMLGPGNRYVNKTQDGPAHSLAKCQNEDYLLISFLIYQLQNPFWDSNPGLPLG